MKIRIWGFTANYYNKYGNSVLLKLENNYIMRQVRSSEYIEKLFKDGTWGLLGEDEKTIIYIVCREGRITVKGVEEALGRSGGKR